MTGCTQCGTCCKKYGWRLEASPLDIARWTFNGNTDILAHVGVTYDERGEVSGGVLWVNSDGTRTKECPFLTCVEGKYFCGIQELKPEVCTAHFCEKY